MESSKVRSTFLDFFKSKGHEIVPSAPMVVKGDPTLMFNNSGMAPFKDIFLGNSPIKYPRIADTQKCLRVSGKHNDLEEVGVDTYHHTMFEMLGNWSFGDYFKSEAIAWAWELLTDVYKIDKSRLYVTVFEGDSKENIPFDQEAYDNWKKYISEDRILRGNKKDNFWEMGDQGPCGPCSEIHCDIRTDEERKNRDAKELVNTGHPQVIEIWNNVFMEFERKADGSLVKLPKQHVDTGMGFERLCVVLQGKQSNYDTDVFTPLISEIEKVSGKKYVQGPETTGSEQEKWNIAMRVIADHIRAISFSIADGQLPGNSGAGYVIRRILRRAIRYGYQSLDLKEPFLFKLSKKLSQQLGLAFPELVTQQQLIEKVIREEENAFYKTLEIGLKRIDAVCEEMIKSGKTKVLEGKLVFELYDTFGFPVDLTSLILRAYGLDIDEEGFQICLDEQKNRSRQAAMVDTEDWVYTSETYKSNEHVTEFIGYNYLEAEVKIIRYRRVKSKSSQVFQLVFDKTPFYAESGGQVGDTGTIERANEVLRVTDTKKENGVIIHTVERLPENLEATYFSRVDTVRRSSTQNNHSATHLLHAALRSVLGTHVEQKGSLVNAEYLRFDFSHFSKLTDLELAAIERMVNEKIRTNIHSDIQEMPIEAAKKKGAMALFGEKYGDTVRVVTFDNNYSIELCGGTHVDATGQIGQFKITSEGAVAAGIRRIEAITGQQSYDYFKSQDTLIYELKQQLKNPKDILKSVNTLLEENASLQKRVQLFMHEKAQQIKNDLIANVRQKNGMNVITGVIELDSSEEVKNILFELRNQVENMVCVLGNTVNGKPNLSVMLSDNIVKDRNLNAGTLVKELAKDIKGGGGGQAFYATAGGTEANGLKTAVQRLEQLI